MADTSAASSSKPARSLPVLQGILPIDGKRVPPDIIAGCTLAALAIPEVMGYTKIAGTRPDRMPHTASGSGPWWVPSSRHC